MTLQKLSTAFPTFRSPEDVGCTTKLWNSIIYALPAVGEPVRELLDTIKIPKALENNKTELWKDSERYPEIENALFGMLSVESELADELKKSEDSLIF